MACLLEKARQDLKTTARFWYIIKRFHAEYTTGLLTNDCTQEETTQKASL